MPKKGEGRGERGAEGKAETQILSWFLIELWGKKKTIDVSEWDNIKFILFLPIGQHRF